MTKPGIDLPVFVGKHLGGAGRGLCDGPEDPSAAKVTGVEVDPRNTRRLGSEQG
jgi:hypothetical protein